MNKLISMKYPIVLMSAFAMGPSIAAADETKCDCPCADNRASVSVEKNQDQYGAANANSDEDRYSASNANKAENRYGAASADKDQDRYGASSAEKDNDHYGVASAEKDQDRHGANGPEMASDRASQTAKDHAAPGAAVHDQDYLTSKPADDYFSESLIGLTVTNRRDDADIGTVEELLIDQDGQIAAVIVSIGGVMGIGEKDLAIAWDQLERKVDGDEITLSVDLSDANLDEAPGFDRE